MSHVGCRSTEDPTDGRTSNYSFTFTAVHYSNSAVREPPSPTAREMPRGVAVASIARLPIPQRASKRAPQPVPRRVRRVACVSRLGPCAPRSGGRGRGGSEQCAHSRPGVWGRLERWTGPAACRPCRGGRSRWPLGARSTTSLYTQATSHISHIAGCRALQLSTALQCLRSHPLHRWEERNLEHLECSRQPHIQGR